MRKYVVVNIVILLAAVLGMTGCEVEQEAPGTGQFALVSSVWVICDEEEKEFKYGSTTPVKMITAPEGKKFLIHYATEVYTTYRPGSYSFKMTLANGEEIEPFGTRLEATFSARDPSSDGIGPDRNPFMVLPLVMGYYVSDQTKYLSLLFVVSPDEITGARILWEMDDGWREVAKLSEEQMWTGPPDES